MDSVTKRSVEEPAQACKKQRTDEDVEHHFQNLSAPEDAKSELKYQSAREKDVGITEYISELPGFSAILKERYSDFLVNEIDLEGNLVKLTDLNEPTQPKFPDDAHTVFSESDLKLLEELCKKPEGSDSVIIDVTDKDKDTRRQMHQVIRNCFQGLDSTTEASGDAKTIVVKRGQSKRRNYHPPGRGNYTHFVLYKENKDTMDAVSALSSFISLPSKNLSYAGTKDKRGKTVQMVSAYRTDARKLLSINKKHPFIKIGNIVYKDSEIKLGDLSGNRFVIILRQVKGDEDLIAKSMASLSSIGFINYYGMQRFGTFSVATYLIGRALLLRNWKEAVDLILHPRYESENNELTHALKIWCETRNAAKAFSKLKRRYVVNSIEGKLLSGLAKHNEHDFVNALNSIPRNTRLMYIHSYQSYIWNKVVSKRIMKYGLKVLEGDMTVEQTMQSEDGENLIPVKQMPKYVSGDSLQKENLIYDVVLPLPGYSVSYPNNETRSWYEEFLEEDGMSMSSFQSNVKSYSLSGAYRKIVVKPANVKWELLQYDDNTKPLVLSDWDILQGVELPPPVKDGSHKALKLEFCLPSSTYATMAVREILKIDTCADVQKGLSAK